MTDAPWWSSRAVVSVSAGQREPYETASPFVGLYQLTEVHTSNDLVE